MDCLTADLLINEVKRIAEQNPDFVYKPDGKDCLYTRSENNEDCGCIFGQAILNLKPELKQILQNFDNSAAVPRINVLLNELEIKTTKKQAKWCCIVQSAQDNQLSWTQAIHRGERATAYYDES